MSKGAPPNERAASGSEPRAGRRDPGGATVGSGSECMNGEREVERREADRREASE